MKISSFSRGERRIIGWIVFLVIVMRIALAFRPEERIYTRPYAEDSFYLFSCAEHFAHGDGFTCDGKQPTNGVQPLIVVLYAPLFLIAGADKLLALKLGTLLIAIFDSISVVLIVRLVKTLQKKPDEGVSVWKSPPIIAAFLWALLYPIFVHTVNGLETGLYSNFLLGFLFYYAKLSRMRNEGNAIRTVQWISLGILLGFMVLARIDAVFLVVLLAAYELYKYRGKGLVSGAIISFFAFLVSSPWWWYNYKVFGSLMPQSGVSEALERGILAENMRRGVIVLGDILTVFFFLPNYDLPAWFHYFWLVAISTIVFWIVRKWDLKKYISERYLTNSFVPYYLFCGSLVIYYIFFFSAPHFLPRYFHPFRIVWLVLFACAAPEIIRRLEALYSKKKKVVLIGIWVFALCAAGFSGSRYIYYFVINKPGDLYLAGKFALQHPHERIGMQQSGTAGFLSPNVVNLDGKVNYSALKAQLRGDIGAYIEEEKLDYLADWSDVTDTLIPSSARHGGVFHEIDSIGKVKVFQRDKNIPLSR